LKKLDELKIADNTLIIFSSDNGPVLDDGYADRAVELAKGHNAAGLLRGGKYSAFEGGTRVPWLARWPQVIKPGTVSDALICQIDMMASFAHFFQQKTESEEAVDSFNVMDAMLGKSQTGRSWLIKQGGALSITQGNWKYIEPREGKAVAELTNIETGANPKPQLYDLSKDIGEKNNVADKYPAKVKAMAAELEKVRDAGRSH
jgi:arylsulfatase A-like enzyme